MAPEIKFCGMTRAIDVEAAVAIGARYVGFVFAAGPRTVGPDQARTLTQHVASGVLSVGVFGPDVSPRAAGELATGVGLHVVQLHGDPNVEAVDAARERFAGKVWAVVRVRGDALANATELFDVADAVVLDAYSPSALGGTGVSLRWAELAETVGRLRRSGKVVLAGGLRPDTVGRAVRALRPDVVDVSSGVESAPGVKDHGKLRAFKAAVDRVANGDPRA